MKKHHLVLFAPLLLIVLSARPIPSSDSCDVQEIYSGVTPKDGTMAIGMYGGVQEVEKLLVPTTMDAGSYKISLISIGEEIFQIEGKNVYLKISYCTPPTGGEAILVWKDDYSKGKVVSEE
jgi:hypothetical protein